MRIKEINIGDRFGDLVVIGIKRLPKSKRRTITCLCNCGKITNILPANIRSNTQSCGCRHLENAQKANAKTKAYPNDPESYQINQLYLQYRSRGLKNKGFTLQRKEFRDLIKSNCYYCGVSPLQKATYKYGNTLIYNGIDRIDNNKGYITDNTVPCCGTCNKMKLTLSTSEFYKHILQIVHHRITGDINEVQTV